MKNKNSLLSLGILVLVLFLSVGYAVVSSVYVSIEGTANAAGADLNVEITDAVAVTNISEKTVDFNHVLSDSNLTSNFTLNNMTLGEIVTITYTVTNNETDVDAVLSLASGVTLSNSNPNYFNVNYEITDASTDLENNDKTMTVVITVELIKTPVSEENSSTTVGLTLTASPAGSDSGSGPSTEVTEVYYNQPYNAVMTSQTYGARTLNAGDEEHIKTIVVYDDHTVELFMDGSLINTYTADSVILENQLLSVDQEFDAVISSDSKTITIGEEIFELNTMPSSLKIGPEYIYFAGYVEDTDDIMMSSSIVFKSNTHMDVYFNGHLFGESLTEYFISGNELYMYDSGNKSFVGYVSIDGTQIVSKGKSIMSYQEKEELYYGRAYSTFYNMDDDDELEILSFVPYNDGSYDIVVDGSLIQTMPAGTIKINDGVIDGAIDGVALSCIIKNDGYDCVQIKDGVEIGAGFILENIWAKERVYDKKYNIFDNDSLFGEFEFKGNNSYTYTLDDGTTGTGTYIISDKAIILEYFPFAILYYDENTGEYSSDIPDGILKLVPVK